MIMRWMPVVAASVFLLAACDRNEEPPQPQVGPTQGNAGGNEPLVSGPRGPAQELPKVPGRNAPSDSGRDDAATQPKGDLTKPEETGRMPEAGQANTHSSEALSDDKTTGSPASGASASGAPTQTAQAGGAAAGAGSGEGGAAASGAAAGAAGGAAGAAQPTAASQDGSALVKQHNCVSCHAVDKKLVGPAYKEVAEKYKGDASAEAKLIEKVKKGGSGVWGPVPMPPHPNVPDDQIKAMVDWVLAGAS